MSDQDPTTQPLPLAELNDVLGLDDSEVEDAKRRLPEASLARAAIVGVLIFVGAAIGKPELAHEAWVDAIVSGYVVAAPVALAVWMHRKHKEDGPTGRHAKP